MTKVKSKNVGISKTIKADRESYSNVPENRRIKNKENKKQMTYLKETKT